jgi:aryl-alcohol dehydrogenase-like predicted oxidoreductase
MGENFDKNLQLVRKVEELAKQKGITPGQLALAWVRAQGNDIVPIPGTTRTKHLKENAAAVDVKLSEEELQQIDAIFPMDITAGDRYSDMSGVNI